MMDERNNVLCVECDFQVTINARIVVVGASNVGVGFLEALAYW